MYACWNARAVGLAMPAEDAIDLAAEAGFAGVDLLVRDGAARGYRGIGLICAQGVLHRDITAGEADLD